MSTEAEHTGRRLDGAVAGGLAWTVGGKSATQLISWLAALISARLLSPADFGLISMAGFFGNLTAVMAEFGLGMAVLQMPELETGVIEQLNTATAIICTLIYGMAVLAAPLIAAFFKSEQLRILVIVNSLGILITGFQSVPNGLLQKNLDYRRLSIAEAAQALLMAVVTVAMAWTGFAYWSLVGGAVAGRVAALILTYYWAPVKFRIPRWREIAPAMRLGSHVAVSRLAGAAYALSDGVIVGRTLGDAALGEYQWAMTLASAPGDKITYLIMRVTGPLFARVQKDLDLMRRYFRIVTEALVLSVFPLMIGLAVVAPEAVRVVLGAKWALAAGPIRWLALFVALRTLSVLFSQVLTSLRDTRFLMWISLVSFVVMPAAFVVASRWGTTAVAASWIVLSPVTIGPLIVRLLKSLQLRYRDFAGIAAPALAACAAMLAAVLAIRLALGPGVRDPAKLAVEVSSGGVVYFAVIWIFFRQKVNRYFYFFKSLRQEKPALAEN